MNFSLLLYSQGSLSNREDPGNETGLFTDLSSGVSRASSGIITSDCENHVYVSGYVTCF